MGYCWEGWWEGIRIPLFNLEVFVLVPVSLLELTMYSYDTGTPRSTYQCQCGGGRRRFLSSGISLNCHGLGVVWISQTLLPPGGFSQRVVLAPFSCVRTCRCEVTVRFKWRAIRAPSSIGDIMLTACFWNPIKEVLKKCCYRLAE